VEYHPVSTTAVWALALSIGALFIMFLDGELRVERGHELFQWMLSLRIALFAVRFVVMIVALTFAYVALFSFPANRMRSGRALAWAALGLSYVLIIWHTAALTMIYSPLKYAVYVLVAVALLHLPVFAAQSSAAKYAVTALLIGGTLMSLLSCALLRSREQSRALVCQKRLSEIGLAMHQQKSFGTADPCPTPFSSTFDVNTALALPRTAQERMPAAPAKRKWIPAD